MVALVPAHVSVPVAAVAMFALASAMSTLAARLRVKLVTVFINFSSLYVIQKSYALPSELTARVEI
jgi:hypothetical protein